MKKLKEWMNAHMPILAKLLMVLSLTLTCIVGYQCHKIGHRLYPWPLGCIMSLPSMVLLVVAMRASDKKTPVTPWVWASFGTTASLWIGYAMPWWIPAFSMEETLDLVQFTACWVLTIPIATCIVYFICFPLRESMMKTKRTA